jgi:ABC-2 type transport system permease protein
MTYDPAPVSTARVFLALLHRDLHVARREWIPFLIRSGLQPLLLVLVFGFLMPRMGIMAQDFTLSLLPGILALTLTLSSIQSVALPMVTDFGFTKEIEDRLLAPIPTGLVALEKVFNGVVQGVVATFMILPFAALPMHATAVLTLPRLAALLAIAVLSSVVFSSFGLVMGTAIPPQHIGMMFAVIFAPMIFFGCTYYPWEGLRAVPALRWAVLLDPLTYVSEGMRAALTPDRPHMGLAVLLAVLVALGAGFTLLGLRTFDRKAIG